MERVWLDGEIGYRLESQDRDRRYGYVKNQVWATTFLFSSRADTYRQGGAVIAYCTLGTVQHDLLVHLLRALLYPVFRPTRCTRDVLYPLYPVARPRFQTCGNAGKAHEILLVSCKRFGFGDCHMHCPGLYHA